MFFFEKIIVYMPGKVFGQNWQIESLWPITPNAAMNHLYFWYGIFFYGLLWENHSLYAGKTLIWRNFDHSSHFWQKLTVLRVLAYNFQTPLWILLSFGTEVVLLVFFEKIILYIPGKFWYGKIVIRPKFGHFCPKLTGLRVLGL